MSFYYKEHGVPEEREYSQHGRTKQCYKDECDVNKILERAQTIEGLSHLEKHGAHYADYSDFDFQSHAYKMAKGQEIFEELPAEIKREFKQNPQAFFEFATDPKNANRLPELFPQLAKRGNFFPKVNAVETRPPETAEVTQNVTTPSETGEPPAEGQSEPSDSNTE